MSGRVPGLPERQQRDVKGLLPAGEPASWFSPTMLRLCSPCPAPPPSPSVTATDGARAGSPAKAAAEERITDGAEARCACEAGSRQETARQAASETGRGGGVGDGGCLGRGPSQAQSQADPPCARHWSLACTAESVQLRVTSCSKAGRLPGPGMQGSGTDVLGHGAGHWPRLCVRSRFPGGRGPAGPGSGGAAHVHGVLPPAPVTRSTSPFS